MAWLSRRTSMMKEAAWGSHRWVSFLKRGAQVSEAKEARMVRRLISRYVMWAALAAVVSSFVVCGQGSDVLVIAMGGTVETLDPQRTINSLVVNVTDQIYDPLLTTDTNMELQPRLAESWELLEDNATWRFHLRRGVVFHDGTPFTAEAVRRTIARATDAAKPAIGSVPLRVVTVVKVVDDYTVDISTGAPFAPLLYHMAHGGSVILSPSSIDQWGEDLGSHPNGTGQFKLEEWVRGEKVVLVRNENYYLPTYLSTVVFQTIPDENTRLIAFETGAADIVMDFPPAEMDRLASLPGLQVQTKPSLRTIYIAMNANDEMFSDLRVRQALNYAVNREEIVEYVMDGLGQVADVPFAPGIWGSAQGVLRVYDFNQRRAEALFNEAGWADTDGDGFLDRDGKRMHIVLNSPEGRYLRDVEVAQAVQAQLRAVGVEVEIRTWEWGGYMASLKKYELPMYLIGLGASTADMDYAASLATDSKGGYNFHQYSNPEVDALIYAARIEMDTETRRGMYLQAQALQLSDAPVIALFHSVSVVAVNTARVEGFEVHPVERVRLNNVRIKNQ